MNMLAMSRLDNYVARNVVMATLVVVVVIVGLDAIFTAPIRGVSRGQSREQLDVKVAVKSMQQ